MTLHTARTIAEQIRRQIGTTWNAVGEVVPTFELEKVEAILSAALTTATAAAEAEATRERTARVNTALMMAQQVSIAEAERDAALADAAKWKDAIIDAVVVGGMYRKAHGDDPRAAINALLCQAQVEALDPTISQAAVDLKATGACEALEQAADMLEQVGRELFNAYYNDAAKRLRQRATEAGQ